MDGDGKNPRTKRTEAGLARSKAQGLSLVETMIVLGVVGILLAGAVPGLGRLLANQRASAATNDLVHGIALARGEALKRGRRVYLAPTTGSWRDGWIVFVDHDDDRRFDAAAGDEPIAHHDALPATTAITNPSSATREPFTDTGSPQRAYLMFDGAGYPRQRNGALHPGSFVVTDRTGGGAAVRTICVAAYGRVRAVADRVGCS